MIMLNKIVIIEDEPLAAKQLEKIIREICGEFTEIDILYSVEESINYFKLTNDINLIFSDIQLGDGISFSIFDEGMVLCPVIFVTAFNEYALSAFKSNGIDYILKPYEKDSIKQSIIKYIKFGGQVSNLINRLSTVREMIGTSVFPKSILIQYKNELIPIDKDYIKLIYLEFGVVKFVMNDNRKISYHKSLTEFEAELGNNFFRVNKQVILHRSVVKSISQLESRKYLIKITIPFEEPIILGRLKSREFMTWLERE